MSTDFVKVREKTHTERRSVHSLSFIITTRLDASTLAYVDAHPLRPRRISRYRGGPELLSFLVEAALALVSPGRGNNDPALQQTAEPSGSDERFVAG